jgi:hypothetical protein
MRPSFLLIGLFAFLSCDRLVAAAKDATSTGGGATARPRAEVPVMRFKTASIIDQQGTGIEAFHVLVPSDWTVEGGVRWVLDRPGSPADAGFRATSPDSSEVFELFPNQNFVWTDNLMTRSMFPVGSRYFGTEVRPPESVLQALDDVVLARFRPGVPDLQVITREEVPSFGQAVAAAQQPEPGAYKRASGAKTRITYTLGGVPVEEEFWGAVETVSFTLPGAFGSSTTTMWTASYLFACRAPRGRLDTDARLFQTIASSIKVNPVWFNKYIQLIETLAQRQIQQIRAVGEISRMMAQTSDEISASRMQTWEANQAARDRSSEAFSQYMRGVDAYSDPNTGGTVELPSGYTQAWSNPLGEYVMTESLDFNPNIGSNQTWTPLTPANP